MIHQLKIERKYFSQIVDGSKTFEVRKDDRNYQSGDYLALNEVYEGEYTGFSMLVLVTTLLNDPKFCKSGFVIMSIQRCSVEPASSADRSSILLRR